MSSLFSSARTVLVLFASLAACVTESDSLGQVFGDGDTSASDGSTSAEDTGGSSPTGGASMPTGGGVDDTGGSEEGEVVFDIGVPDAPGETGDGCRFPEEHTPCDADSEDPWRAMGINCPGEIQVQTSFSGQPDQLHVHTGTIGTYVPATWPVREGEKVTILSSGVARWLLNVGVEMSWMVGPYEEMMLPPPMVPDPVSMTETCAENPGLIGTGDCSNTIWPQWSQGEMGAFDLAELRMEFDVPPGVEGFSFDFAFFTDEYPEYYGTGYNDMFLVWLESSTWTGNISFDDQGNPISLNAAFLDFKDAHHPSCPGCSAPEVQGTAMEGHVATRWLTTTAPLTPGDHVTVQFVIFDLTDAILDSTVVIDNFRWTCIAGPPSTEPAG